MKNLITFFRSFWFATLTKRGLWNLATLFRRALAGPPQGVAPLVPQTRFSFQEKGTPFLRADSKKMDKFCPKIVAFFALHSNIIVPI